MQEKIAITAISSFSALGFDSDLIWREYLKSNTLISKKLIGNKLTNVAAIPDELNEMVTHLKQSEHKYKALDPSVLYAILASREAIIKAGWIKDAIFGINIGSSRGATTLFEKHHSQFLESGKTSSLSSPTTTLGNISSWVSHDLKASGIAISHSVTCSTALHSLLNGVASCRNG